MDEFPPPPVGDPSASKIASSTSKLQQLHQRIGLWNWWSQSHIEPAGQSKNITADDRVGRKGEEPTPGQFPSSPCSSSMSGSPSTTADSPSKSRPQSATSFTTQLCSPRFSASTLFAAGTYRLPRWFAPSITPFAGGFHLRCNGSSRRTRILYGRDRGNN